MKQRLYLPLCWMMFAALPGLAQETLYPVPGKTDLPVVLTEDHTSFVVEKAFEYKITFGFPTDDKTAYLPNTKTRMVVLWLRVQNLSQKPVEVNLAKFTSTDDQGRNYSPLAPEEAFDRMIAAGPG